MLIAVAPDTLDIYIRTELNDGLKPLELSYLIYDITNIYNIILFSHTLVKMRKIGNILTNEGSNTIAVNEEALPPKYKFREALNEYITQNLDSLNEQDIHWSIEEYLDDFQLSLKRINYNSPGSLDLMGIGKIVEQVKEFILKIIELKFERKRTQQELRKQDLEIRKQEVELYELTEKQEHEKRMREVDYENKLLDIEQKELDLTLKYLTIDNNILSNNPILRESLKKSASRLFELVQKRRIGEFRIVYKDE